MDTRRERLDLICRMIDTVFRDVERMEDRDINIQPFNAEERAFHNEMVKLYHALQSAAFTLNKLPIDYHF